MPEITWGQQRQLRSFFVDSIRNHPQNPIVISEGDSWFSFPVHANLIDHLDELVGRRMSLLRLENPGDELLEMAAGSQFAMLRDYLDRYRPDVLLFSGGGNDIVGPELLQFIAPRPAAFDVDAALATDALRQRFQDIRAAYARLIQMRREVAPACIVVTHGYADVVPTGKKAIMWGFSAGPWIKPFLIERGYTDPGEHRAIVRALMAQFNEIVDSFADPHFIKVDFRGVISDTEWNDEIHPSRKGFEDAARKLHRTLQGLLPDKFP
ncbi:MAG TPA: SGNH/GDSL hydrolase family protein [Thermoanaerobaculia bacterium]|jgi:lysophospholipase L1-like esterase